MKGCQDGGVTSRISHFPHCLGTQYHAIPYHNISRFTISYHALPYHTVLYHTIPYHAIPFHTIPYHTIPLFRRMNARVVHRCNQSQSHITDKTAPLHYTPQHTRTFPSTALCLLPCRTSQCRALLYTAHWANADLGNGNKTGFISPPPPSVLLTNQLKCNNHCTVFPT